MPSLTQKDFCNTIRHKRSFHNRAFCDFPGACCVQVVARYGLQRVAIIVSGNSTKREYIQRLGRVLRPKVGQALLYELVTTGTTEEDIAKRRK